MTAINDIGALNLQPGDKITVRSTDSRRDGYVYNDGRFLRYEYDREGQPYMIVYDWTANYVGQAFLNKCRIERREREWRA